LGVIGIIGGQLGSRMEACWAWTVLREASEEPDGGKKRPGGTPRGARRGPRRAKEGVWR
jgi:hypothetical protein